MSKTNDDTTKHTLHLRTGDYQRLRDMFPEVGAAFVIRRLVSQFLDSDKRTLNLEAEEIQL
jgi:hypothetical protein